METDTRPVQTETDALLETAWGIIANAGGGNWDLETPEWKEAAERWRDKYFEQIPAPQTA